MPSKLSCVGVPAATDILLGYHSEEGWTAAIHLLTGHYGLDVEVGFPTCILPLRMILSGCPRCQQPLAGTRCIALGGQTSVCLASATCTH